MPITILITGGTFDKEYDELTGELFFKDTHLKEMLDVGRCLVDTDLKTTMMIDSLDMEDSDREIIATHCSKIKSDKILITHGTDTMIETALVIARNVKDKTIVITGAMVPYAFGSSDGLFNLGSALAYANSLPNGVYISMNGKYFEYNKVKKDKKLGVFISK